jgi:two-component system response regulator FixJ
VRERVIYLIDDDGAMRDSLSFLLTTAGHQVEAFESPLGFLAQSAALKPGCIITDVRMPEINGLQLVRRLKEGGVGLPIIMITGHGDVPIAVEAMKAGIKDFIEKPFSDETILSAVEAALAGSIDQRRDDPERLDVQERIASLTDRERQVMEGVVAGDSNKVIAQNLGISPRTVDIYRANVMTKMRASSLSQLVRLAITAGAA